MHPVCICRGTYRNKKARAGRAFQGVSDHVGTCGNLHLVEPGGFEPVFLLRFFLQSPALRAFSSSVARIVLR